MTPPFESGRAKGTVYQGGVNVPLIVAGPGVAGGATSDALINSVDLYATILEMAEVDFAEAVPAEVNHDSVSFFPNLADPDLPALRDWVYADVFSGSFAGIQDANYTMRNDRYKLLRHQGVEEFYDLVEDPYEHANLLEGPLSARQQAQYRILRDQIDELRAGQASEGLFTTIP